MSEHTTEETGEVVASVPVKMFPDMDPRYPLNHMHIAMHLGIPVWRAEDAEENLRRVKALVKTFSDHGVTLLNKGDGSPFTEDDVTPELIAQHEGQTANWGTYTPASFDDHLLDIIASQTGKPRVSYVHIRKETPRVGHPIDIYQEIDDKTHHELRRVEVYLDGRHLWVEDTYTGTGNTDADVDVTHFPGLTILNDRPGQRAHMTSEGEFQKLWEQATDEGCGWASNAGACLNDRTEDSAFCPVHDELARRMFPRLFETA